MTVLVYHEKIGIAHLDKEDWRVIVTRSTLFGIELGGKATDITRYQQNNTT